MHDDRAYCLALAGYYLHEKRLEHIRKKKRNTPDDINSYFKIKTPEKPHSYFS